MCVCTSVVALTQLRPSLQACAALPDDNPLKGLGGYKDAFGILRLRGTVHLYVCEDTYLRAYMYVCD
jgi:hypothetical protein